MQLYSTLQSQMTEAELDLQRGKPVVTVLEHPVPPRWPHGSRPWTVVILSLFLGFVAGASLAFAKAFVEKKRSKEEGRLKVEEIREALVPNFILNRVWHRRHEATQSTR